MNLSNQEQIEHYLLGLMDEGDSRAFEKRLLEDPSLAEEFQYYKWSLQAIGEHKKQELRFKLKKLESSLQKGGKNSNYSFFWILFVLLALVYFLRTSWRNKERVPITQPVTESKLPDSIPRPDSSGHPPLETDEAKQAEALKSVPAARPTSKQRVVSPGKLEKADESPHSADSLFAANFRPFRDEALNLNIRGNSGFDYYQKFLNFYKQDEFLSAIAVYDSLSLQLQRNDNCLFLKANALMATGNMANSQSYLEKIVQDNKSRYVKDAKWYLMLIALKTRNQRAYAKWRDQILSDEENPYRSLILQNKLESYSNAFYSR